MNSYNITIIGGGIVGLTTALLLAKDPHLNILVLEANTVSSIWEKEKTDHRVSAISLASQEIFKKVNTWEKIKNKRISPYQKMFVWDESGGHIHFESHEVAEEQLGFIIEDNIIKTSLLETLSEYENITVVDTRKLISLTEKENGIEITTDHNEIIQTELLIGADGANSQVRKLVGIDIATAEYGHTAIVATIETEFAHQQTAWQRFLISGPLAFLPLAAPYQSSIVWSTTPDHAKEILAIDDAHFSNALRIAFQNKLGKITKISPRFSFPLVMRHAKNYVKNRLVLLGDAAHTIHPMAGQGVNLGLLDASSLNEVIQCATLKNRDFFTFAILRKYERERKSYNLLMLKAIDVLKTLFSTQSTLTQQLRVNGLKATAKFPILKRFLINYALGKSQI